MKELEVSTYYYNKEKNIMIDEDGFEIFNIFNIISPNSLFLFKYKKDDMFVFGTSGKVVELIYPDNDDIWNNY